MLLWRLLSKVLDWRVYLAGVTLISVLLATSADETVQVEVQPHPASPSPATTTATSPSVISTTPPPPLTIPSTRWPAALPLPSDLSSLPRDTFPPVIWFAPFYSGGGYSSEALSFLASLHPHLSPSLQSVQHGDSLSYPYYAGLPYTTQLLLHNTTTTELPPHSAVVICHSEPGAWHPPNYETSRCPPAHSGVRIGRTMFETDRLPDGWMERLNGMDYVWVPTDFHRHIFIDGGVDSDKLVVIGEPVDVDTYKPAVVAKEYVRGERQRWAKGKEQRPFRFLSIFKWEERKGWPILLTAYLSEFTASDPVELWILTSAYHSDTDFNRKIANFTATLALSHPPPVVRLLHSGVPAADMPGVYAAADAFVLPSRGEGWGRPHVEAMSMGLPVIATRWSGPSHFMTDNNSFPLEHDRLDTITTGPFIGHRWARPSTAHLRALMRWVYVDEAERRRRGGQARRDMEELYCPQCVARSVLQELSRFASVRYNPPPPPRGKHKKARWGKDEKQRDTDDVDERASSSSSWW